MMDQPALHRRAIHLADAAVAATARGPLAGAALELRTRLNGPVRVAVAGRVKAGKSTLLNALVGERLAPTDAGECTRIVTLYRGGLGYEVSAFVGDASARPLEFRRNDGALEVQLNGLEPDQISRIEVAWPASLLSRMTLIDTPGLASLDERNSLRTVEFLSLGADRPSDADAVVYLMHHVHRADAEFLDAFLDRSLGNVSPVNAIAVLSRADEIGAARRDAMRSARRIAERLRADPDLRMLCSTVLPLAGLLAETGLTLREREAAALRRIASLPAENVSDLLLSTDRFCAPGAAADSASDVSVEERRALVSRFGMFGLRLAIDEIRAGRAPTAVDLARLLVAESGVDDLRAVIFEHFLPRARSLQARSVLSGVRRLARRLRATDPAAGERLEADAERVESSSHELAELRLAHLLMTGAVRVTAGEAEEIRRLVSGGSVADRLGLDADAASGELQAAAVAAVERWRSRMEDPIADRLLVEGAGIVVRSLEGLYLAARALHAGAGGP